MERLPRKLKKKFKRLMCVGVKRITKEDLAVRFMYHKLKLYPIKWRFVHSK